MKRGLVFIVLLLFLVSFSFVVAENATGVQTTNNQDLYNNVVNWQLTSQAS